MEVSLAVLFALALAANASPVADDFEDVLRKERDLYPRYLEIPDAEGVTHTVDLAGQVDYEALDAVLRNPANTDFLLYTRRNLDIPQPLIMNDVSSILGSNFDPKKETVFVAHGWLSKSDSEPNPTVRAVFLNKKDVNVITIVWSRLANLDYITAASGVPAVGRGAGEFINWLNRAFGLRYDNVHLIGFSLGAHLVGNAGRSTSGRVARITGLSTDSAFPALDPAGPLWNFNSNSLNAQDGVYVEGIHTDGGYTVGGLGIGKAIAQVDFFPNGGISQPGCWTNVCNHARAWELFGASVTHNHLWGQHCRNNLQITLNRCRGEALPMGNDDLRKTAVHGSYRVNTARRYPF